MIMGSVCTRGCRFCAVNTSRNGLPLDPNEPKNLAAAISEMELDYVVLTSVNRDDLPDQGASHFAACIRAIRKAAPNTLIEVLIPDFCGRPELIVEVVDAKPDVIAHNIECVQRMTPKVRDPRAGYDQTLSVLSFIRQWHPTGLTKSSIMVGVGETKEEVIQTMRDLRNVETDFLTIGQYLQPTTRHLKLVEYIHPDTFEHYREIGESMGFKYVASGPLVRSSYKAGEFFIAQSVRAHQTVLGVTP